MKLSLIIPIYNVERYIERCLQSCLNQDLSFSEYEIIAVDDGSPDNSKRIVKLYQEQYPNINLIIQENKGLSGARNTGLRIARGEYVWFIDSDDFIEPNCISHFYQEAHNQSLDILPFSISFLHENKNDKSPCDLKRKSIPLSGKDYLLKGYTFFTAWSAIYKRDFLLKNNLFFMEGIFHEDQEFTPRAYYLAKRVNYTSRLGYIYYQRKNTISTSSKKRKRSHDLLAVADSLYNFISKKECKKSEIYIFFIEKVNHACIQSINLYCDKQVIKYIKSKKYYPLYRTQNNYRISLKIDLFNFSIYLYRIIYILFKLIYKLKIRDKIQKD